MERKSLIVSGIGAVVIAGALVMLLMTRGGGEDDTTPVADTAVATTASASPSASPSTTAPPAAKVGPTTATTKPAPVTTTTPAADPPPTEASGAKVFARPPATVESRANNTYTFYVEQLTPLNSTVDVHLLANGTGLTLHCPAPVAPGNCQVSWTTGSHDLAVTYYVTVDPVDPRYKTYNSTPLQFTTG